MAYFSRGDIENGNSSIERNLLTRGTNLESGVIRRLLAGMESQASDEYGAKARHGNGEGIVCRCQIREAVFA